MATIIDSLVVTLGLDPRNFGKGHKEARTELEKFNATVKRLGIDETKLDGARKKDLQSLRDAATQAQRTGKELKSAGGAGEDFWNVMKAGVAGFGVAMGVEGLKALAMQAIQTNAAISRVSGTLGMQAGEVDAWKKAVREATGSSGAGAIGTLQGISDTLAKYMQTGDPGDLPRIMNILQQHSKKALAWAGANGQPLSPDQMLLQWADPVKNMGLQQAHGLLGGMIDDDTLQFLSKGREADEAALAAARNNTLTPKGFSDADKAAKQLNQLSDAIGHLSDTLALMGTPRAIRDITQFNALLGVTTGKISPAEYFKQYQAAQDEYAGDPGGIKRKTDEAMGAIAGPPMFDPGNPNIRYHAPDATGGYVRWTDDERRARLAQLISAGMTPQKAAAKVAFEEGMGMPAAHFIAKGLPPNAAPSGLLGAIEKVESHGNPNAVSEKNAQGVMQIIPSTWAHIKSYDPGIGDDPFNPDASRRAGADYLNEQFAKYHDWAKAVAAYFGGPDTVDNAVAGGGDMWARFLPPKTSAYLTAVTTANGGLPSNETNINVNGPINVNVPNGNPDTIAKGIKNSLVAQSMSGPR